MVVDRCSLFVGPLSFPLTKLMFLLMIMGTPAFVEVSKFLDLSMYRGTPLYVEIVQNPRTLEGG
jgi:hypothetical protein